MAALGFRFLRRHNALLCGRIDNAKGTENPSREDVQTLPVKRLLRSLNNTPKKSRVKGLKGVNPI